jgi:ketosteroid isomerase-like protein
LCGAREPAEKGGEGEVTMKSSIATRVACLALLSPCVPVAAQTAPDAAVNRTIDAFVAAQRGYDAAALKRLTTPDYVEVSPVGDVDSRDEMLGFYAPDKKRPSPAIGLSEREVRIAGPSAIALAKLTMTVPGPGGAAREIAMRATFTARRVGSLWQLSSAQYTPIRAN